MARCTSIAQIRFISRLLTVSLLTVGVTYYSKWAFVHYHPTGWKIYVLALLPALLNVASLVVVGLYISEEKDEFERTIIIRSALWGLGAALAIGTTWSTLDQFALMPHPYRSFSSALTYLSFWLVWAISGSIIRLRYR